MKRLSLIVVYLFVLLEIGTSLTCLQCEGVSHPRHCRFVADCLEGDVCAVESVKNSLGQQMYKVGCVPTSQCSNSSLQSDKCHECCNTNLCNAQGCGELGYPTERGPICYHCPAAVDVNMCNTIEFCETGEVCHFLEREEFGDVVYTGKCASKIACNGSVVLGNVVVGRDVSYETNQRRESSDNTFTGIRSLKATRCEGCCGVDLCNKGCNITKVPPSDCYDIQQMGLGTSDGIYNITLWRTNKKIQVLCDLTTDGGGWTVFQNRFDGSVDFYRNFINYTSGFGNPAGEFWLGLDIIHEMTRQRLTELRIDVTAADGRKGYEVFKNFSILEGPGYVLQNLPGTGTLDHSNNFFTYHTGQSFSTYDQDHDNDFRNCAREYRGGWWYNNCYHYNLNGQYLSPGTENPISMNIGGFSGNHASLRSSRMMFRVQH